jgi:hypothetical protein
MRSLLMSASFLFSFSQSERHGVVILNYLICMWLYYFNIFSDLIPIFLCCRSLFVPYFKYLLEGCVHHLTDAGDAKTSGLTQKKKKAKIQEANNMKEDYSVLSLRSWHLRALVISSLHKCFLYDTGSLKFLDSSNFQASQSLSFLPQFSRTLYIFLTNKLQLFTLFLPI